MQFFYIDYMDGDRKEKNAGFLRVERSGVCVGLRGIPMQCGNKCSVYAVGECGEKWRMGEILLKNGYGMGKLGWGESRGFEKCVCVEVPFYRNKKGVCVLRQSAFKGNTDVNIPKITHVSEIKKKDLPEPAVGIRKEKLPEPSVEIRKGKLPEPSVEIKKEKDLPDKLPRDKWEQLADAYPHVHIFPEAQSLLIKPKDLVVLTQRYNSLVSNSFVLHSYYNYRQLLLFKFPKRQQADDMENDGAEYYVGVPGVYYEREKKIAQMFGFECFDIGEARMREEEKRKIYEGCFGYYMKQVEI